MKQLIKLLLPLLLLFPSVVFTKTADNTAPVHIAADQVEMRERDDISIYKGHVIITRGSIKITGNEIIIKNKQGKLQSISITGKPATFFQLNDLGEEISAESNEMSYLANTGLLEFRENAVLVKNQNRFSSEHIIYDANKDIVTAGNNNSDNDKNNNKPELTETPRVQITIHPEKGTVTKP